MTANCVSIPFWFLSNNQWLYIKIEDMSPLPPHSALPDGKCWSINIFVFWGQISYRTAVGMGCSIPMFSKLLLSYIMHYWLIIQRAKLSYKYNNYRTSGNTVPTVQKLSQNLLDMGTAWNWFDLCIYDLYCSQPQGCNGDVLSSHLRAVMLSIFMYVIGNYLLLYNNIACN